MFYCPPPIFAVILMSPDPISSAAGKHTGLMDLFSVPYLGEMLLQGVHTVDSAQKLHIFRKYVQKNLSEQSKSSEQLSGK